MSGSRAAHRRGAGRGGAEVSLGTLALVLATALLVLLPTSASAATGGEGMPSFTAVYDVQPDGSMRVTETITWRFPAGRSGTASSATSSCGWGGTTSPTASATST